MSYQAVMVNERDDGYSIEARGAEDEAGTELPDGIEFGIFDGSGQLCLNVTVSNESAEALLADLAKLLGKDIAS